MNPKVCLITGANRGIGLEFVKQLLRLTDPPKLIFAACRNPDQAQDLRKLTAQSRSVKILMVDLTKLKEIEKVKEEVESTCGDDGLNLLVNNAGVFPLESLEELTEDSLKETLQVNTIAPVLVTKTFLPLLRKSASSQVSKSMSCSKAAIVNISSDYGSIGLGQRQFETEPACFGYRMSKAALNMFSANLAHDLKSEKILVAMIHPGWVSTDMGLSCVPDEDKDKDPAAVGMVSVEDSVTGIIKVLSKIDENDTGCFVDYTGKAFPW